MLDKEEEVLVIKRDLFNKIGSFQGINFDFEKYISSILDSNNNYFIEKDKAEKDVRFKQIIPYIIFQYKDTFLEYRRGIGSGESRLKSKKSIGIGGHVNYEDYNSKSIDKTTYRVGIEREIKEEIFFSGNFIEKVVGIINDDSNDVGLVHLGIVHLFKVDSNDITSNENSIQNIKFSTHEDLIDDIDNFETWSQLCIKSLEKFK